MTRNYKQIIIAAVTFIGGLYFFLEFILPESILEQIAGPNFSEVHRHISRSTILVGAMAIGLGIINLLRVHVGSIAKRKKRWINSVALLAGLFATFFIEGFDFQNAEQMSNEVKEISILVDYTNKIKNDYDNHGIDAESRVQLLIEELSKIRSDFESNKGFLRIHTETPKEKQAVDKFLISFGQAQTNATQLHSSYLNHTTDNAELENANKNLITTLKETASHARDITALNYEKTTARKSSHFFFEAFFVPLGSAMFSLLAFYVATAAYRTFRVRSFEAFLMMSAAIVVMLGQIAHGPLYIHEQLPQVRLWLLENISTPAFRAITFGSGVAWLAMAVRMWLSLEKSPLAVDDSYIDTPQGSN